MTGLDQPNGSTQTETGSSQNVLPKHIVLHVAALRGDFETAEKYGDDLKEPISRNRETALHIATLAGQKEFVKKLVEKFGPSIREIQNRMGTDALSYAATMGSLEMVKVIVEAGEFNCLSPESPESLESRKKAFLMAAGLGHQDITKYLFKLTELQVLEHEEMRRLYIYCVEMGLYVKEFLKFDEEAQIFDTREAEKSLFIAAEVGNVDFIIKLIELNPNLLWTMDDEKGSIFHVAVQHRQEKIFSLLLELGGIKEVIAKVITGSKRNSLLHLVAELPPDREKLNTVCGAALQLHRELVWFKEVAKIIPTAYKDMKNSDGKTAQALFAETHKELRKEGEKWMKEAAQSSTIVATLIAGAIFAATFSVPGGFDSTSGQPSL
nr:ankyrin repeat-containing protein ITN1-like [Ziziphus jujuba var. spinosa]